MDTVECGLISEMKGHTLICKEYPYELWADQLKNYYVQTILPNGKKKRSRTMTLPSLSSPESDAIKWFKEYIEQRDEKSNQM